MKPFLLCFPLVLPVQAAPSLDAQLLSTSEKGDIKTAQLLVRRGAHVNARNERKQTPLMLAAMHSDERLVRFLLAKSADVKARDDSGFSVLGYGATLTDLLLKHGAKATRGDSEALSDWLENGIWIDSDIEDEDVKADARALLRAGMNLNANGFDEKGTTPLLNAVDSRPSLVLFLLDLGANPNVGDKRGRTPLIAAMSPLVPSEGATDSVALLLLKRGAKPNSRTESGETSLMMAAGTNNLALVKELLRRGVNPDLADKRGETALMRAASAGLPDVVRLFLRAGADTQKKNVQGKTALDYAKSRDLVSVGIFNGAMSPQQIKQLEEQREREWQRALHGRVEVQAILQGKAK